MQLNDGELMTSDKSQVAGEEQGGKASLNHPLSPATLNFPLAFQGETRAVWRVRAHRDGEDFTDADRRILTTLARQAETALGNVLLVETLRAQLDEIRASRATLAQMQRQLLRSREEERARLARELHDGPLQDLVGLNLQLGLLITAGATTVFQSTVGEAQSAGRWKLPLGGPCEDFIVRAAWFDQENKAVFFTDFDYKPFEKRLTICPP